MPALIDLVGQRFGRYVVTSRFVSRARNAKWNVTCDCGSKRIVSGLTLRAGKAQSCGCANPAADRARRMGQANRRHGESAHADNTPEYRVWRGALDRCLNKRSPQYADYGGRGIIVCERWRISFEAFLGDMGRRPSPKHSLDRIDVNGHYEPDNCRWATPKQQQRNRRSNRIVSYEGKSMPLVEAAERAGIRYSVVKGRIHRGWSVDRALEVA